MAVRLKIILMTCLAVTHLSCAALFGWKVHAPGILSNNFAYQIRPLKARVALFPDPGILSYVSKDKGGFAADPQTYYIGKAFYPMLVEAFQEGFEEFILMETEPTPGILQRYNIDYLIMVRIREFDNNVRWPGVQGVQLQTEILVLDQGMNKLALFEAKGASETKGVFAKKGGLEVNLNAAMENNLIATVQYLHDGIRRGNWGQTQ